MPRSARVALGAYGRSVAAEVGGPGLRPVPEGSLHLTLCFLGAVAVVDVEDVAAAVRTGVARGPTGPAPELAVEGASWLPRGRPGVLAVVLVDAVGRAAALQAAVGEHLAAGGWWAGERRPWLPHVTVARVRRGAGRLPRVPPAVGGAAAGVRVAVEEVVLYRSVLGGGPARYEALARVPVG